MSAMRVGARFDFPRDNCLCMLSFDIYARFQTDTHAAIANARTGYHCVRPWTAAAEHDNNSTNNNGCWLPLSLVRQHLLHLDMRTPVHGHFTYGYDVLNDVGQVRACVILLLRAILFTRYSSYGC